MKYEVDPASGTKDWTDVRQFNLMFSTQLGNIAGTEDKLYLHPETAQGIFVNYLKLILNLKVMKKSILILMSVILSLRLRQKMLLPRFHVL